MILGTLKLHDSPDPAALLTAAARLGVSAIDTADVYGAGGTRPHRTEALLAELGTSLPLQTKAGLKTTGPRWRPCGTAKHLTSRAQRSAELLGTPALFFLHVVDPSTGLDRSWRALQKLKSEGIVRRIGLSNPRYHEVQRALELGDLDAVQIALSPFAPEALESGIVRLCRDNDVEVQAHSPVGGWRRKRRTVRAFRDLCREHAVSHERLTLRWLESLGVEPVIGCTRVETLKDAMGAVPPEALQAAREALPVTRFATDVPDASGVGHVALICGLPAAGKTTHAHRYVEQGYERLNRDTLGGTLKGVIKRLDALLDSIDEASDRRVVLDNTWTDRHLRHRVVRVAARHGCRVTAAVVETPFEQCQVQAIRRILADGQGLPDPQELRKNARPHWFGPEVLFRMRERFEPLTDDEGFGVERLSPPDLSWGTASATILNLDALEAGPDAFDTPCFAAVWTPDAPRRSRLDAARARWGDPLLDVRTCSHPPGPARCWCRKPLPGMVVDLLLAHDLNPTQTVLVGGSAEKTLAGRMGMAFRALSP